MQQKIILLWLLAASLAACSKSQSPEEIELANIQEQMALLTPHLDECEALDRENLIAEGERSKAQWDQAAAANIDNVSPEQEQEIRLSLSKELGIAPSKIDWRGIYKSRAEQAKAPATKGNDYDRLCADRGRKTVELNRLLTREEKLTWKQGR